MPTFELTSPEGKKYRVTGPEGATEQQALGMLQAKLTPPDPKPTGDLSWGDVGKGALKSAIPSAIQFGKDIAQPFLHPIDTAESLYKLGQGVAQKTGLMGGSEYEPYADAVGQHFKDRYGGMENIKRTLATDPVGLAADVSVPLTAGGSLAARAPGMAGTLGRATATVGRAVDPLTAPLKVGGKIASEVVGGLTGAGPEALRSAARSGAEGGAAGQAFRENMRGAQPMEEVVAEARQALGKIRESRGADYRAGMKDVSKDKTILSFNDLDTAIGQIQGVKTYKGQVLSPSTEKIREKMIASIDDWRNLQASEFHTVEGFDALKQKLGDIRDATQYGTPERRVADEIYNAAKGTIVKQAPEYAKVMKGYETATRQIKEIEKTLSLNPNASIDTALRKLQSAMRDNVNTNFGQRKKLAEFLMKAGAPNLMQRLAGQAMSAWSPRGLAKMVGAEVLAAGAGAFGAGAGGAGAAALGVIPFMSPRLMGEAAHLGGRVAGTVGGRLPDRAAFQAGRLADQLEPREMVRQDARAALRDKPQERYTSSEIDAMRAVARGSAPVDQVLQVKKMLERGAPQERINRAFGSWNITRDADYGGPQ